MSVLDDPFLWLEELDAPDVRWVTERGLWRRTTPDQYHLDEPEWKVLLDVDALNEAEGENWTWDDVTVLRPTFDRCLISLSRGGADAVVVREFDLRGRAFVEDAPTTSRCTPATIRRPGTSATSSAGTWTSTARNITCA